MKRNWLFLVIILLIGLIVNSCGDDEKPTCAEACPESQRDHLGINENCNHNGKTIQGSCECTLKIYGNISTSNIPIYRESAVSNTDAVIAAGHIVAGFDMIADSFKNTIRDKVSAVHISAIIDNITCLPDGNSKYIITFGANIGIDYGIEEIKNRFDLYATTTLSN